jgi:hypothetical protein
VADGLDPTPRIVRKSIAFSLTFETIQIESKCVSKEAT